MHKFLGLIMGHSYVTSQQEIYFVYRGILFLREKFGGFNLNEARYLLPRIIKACRDSYVEGKKLEEQVENNGESIRIMIRGREVVKAK